MASNVPLTIQTGLMANYGSAIVIGSNQIFLDYQLNNQFWVVVIDRTDLSVKLNLNFSANNAVPSQLNQYIGNGQYLMIFTTQNLSSTNLPTGALYQFLTQQGAANVLNDLEQIYEALNCGSWGWMSYLCVAMLDNSGSAYEFSNIYNPAMVNTFQLIPVQVGNQTLYTPVSV